VLRFGLPEPDSEIVHTFYPLLAGSIMEAQMRSDDEGDTGSGVPASQSSHICHLLIIPAQRCNFLNALSCGCNDDRSSRRCSHVERIQMQSISASAPAHSLRHMLCMQASRKCRTRR
jgi:hypothetical protein